MKRTDVSVGVRLGVAFAVIILLFAAVATYQISRIAVQRQSKDRLIDHYAGTVALFDVQREILVPSIEIITDAVSGNLPSAHQALANLTSGEAALVASVRQRTDIPALRSKADAVESAFDSYLSFLTNQYLPAFEKAYAGGGARQSRSGIASLAALTAEVNSNLKALIGPADDLSDALEKLAAGENRKYDALTLQMTLVIAIVTGSGAAIALLLSLFITRSIRRDILSILKVFDRMEQGDLTSRSKEAARDEIGRMGRSLNAVSAKLARLIGSVKTASDGLSEAGGSLVTRMETTAESVTSIDRELRNVKSQVENETAAVNESTAAVEQIARNIDVLNGRLADQVAAIVESASSVEQLVANIKSVKSSVEKIDLDAGALLAASESGKQLIDDSVKQIERTAQQSESLIKANTAIVNIATTTNLLSMNAAIEAAHAGDAGRGFAVVAAEIRKLADDATFQSQDIGKALNSLKLGIDSAAKASRSAGETFADILSRVSGVRVHQGEIRAAMDEQSTGSQEVLATVHEMNEIAQDIRDRSVEIEKASAGVLEEMRRLLEVSQTIMNSVNGIASSTSEIASAVEKAVDLTQTTNNLIGQTAQESRKFVV